MAFGKDFKDSSPGRIRTFDPPVNRNLLNSPENAPNDYVFQCLKSSRTLCMVQDSLRENARIRGGSTAFCGIAWNDMEAGCDQ